MAEFEFDEAGERVFTTPEICLNFNDGVIPCRYDNVLVKEFGDPQFNHIEWTNEEGEKMGIRAPAEVINRLKELKYPSHFEPFCKMDDPSSFEWFVNLVMQDVMETEHVPESWTNDAT